MPPQKITLNKEKSQKRIEDAFHFIEGKLEKFKNVNNPNKMADLRKYCTTSITGGISSRLLLESGSGETNGKAASGSNTQTDTHPRMTKRHYQSTSEFDLNQSSLITVDENIQKVAFAVKPRHFQDENCGPSIKQDESNTIDQSIIDLEKLVQFNDKNAMSIMDILDDEWRNQDSRQGEKKFIQT